MGTVTTPIGGGGNDEWTLIEGTLTNPYPSGNPASSISQLIEDGRAAVKNFLHYDEFNEWKLCLRAYSTAGGYAFNPVASESSLSKMTVDYCFDYLLQHTSSLIVSNFDIGNTYGGTANGVLLRAAFNTQQTGYCFSTWQPKYVYGNSIYGWLNIYGK